MVSPGDLIPTRQIGEWLSQLSFSDVTKSLIESHSEKAANALVKDIGEFDPGSVFTSNVVDVLRKEFPDPLNKFADGVLSFADVKNDHKNLIAKHADDLPGFVHMKVGDYEIWVDATGMMEGNDEPTCYPERIDGFPIDVVEGEDPSAEINIAISKALEEIHEYQKTADGPAQFGEIVRSLKKAIEEDTKSTLDSSNPTNNSNTLTFSR